MDHTNRNRGRAQGGAGVGSRRFGLHTSSKVIRPAGAGVRINEHISDDVPGPGIMPRAHSTMMDNNGGGWSPHGLHG